MHLVFQLLRSKGSTTLTTKPLHHDVLGMSHYSKVTSPLRRYGDMIAHWQIEAALRAEAEGTKLSPGVNTNDIVPFSEGLLKQMMLGLHPREALIQRTMRYAEDSWLCQLLFRAFHYGECELPKTMTAMLAHPPSARQDRIQIYIKELSCQGAMFKPEDHGLTPAQNGDAWEVELYSVDVYYRRMSFKPIRLISRWED